MVEFDEIEDRINKVLSNKVKKFDATFTPEFWPGSTVENVIKELKNKNKVGKYISKHPTLGEIIENLTNKPSDIPLEKGNVYLLGKANYEDLKITAYLQRKKTEDKDIVTIYVVTLATNGDIYSLNLEMSAPYNKNSVLRARYFVKKSVDYFTYTGFCAKYFAKKISVNEPILMVEDFYNILNILHFLPIIANKLGIERGEFNLKEMHNKEPININKHQGLIDITKNSDMREVIETTLKYEISIDEYNKYRFSVNVIK